MTLDRKRLLPILWIARKPRCAAGNKSDKVMADVNHIVPCLFLGFVAKKRLLHLVSALKRPCIGVQATVDRRLRSLRGLHRRHDPTMPNRRLPRRSESKTPFDSRVNSRAPEQNKKSAG